MKIKVDNYEDGTLTLFVLGDNDVIIGTATLDSEGIAKKGTVIVDERTRYSVRDGEVFEGSLVYVLLNTGPERRIATGTNLEDIKLNPYKYSIEQPKIISVVYAD